MKKRREQLDLKLGDKQKRSSGPERTLEVNCTNCGAKFVAYYGYDEENVETVEVQSCGLCHGSFRKRDSFKGCKLRLLVEVTARQ